MGKERSYDDSPDGRERADNIANHLLTGHHLRPTAPAFELPSVAPATSIDGESILARTLLGAGPMSVVGLSMLTDFSERWTRECIARMVEAKRITRMGRIRGYKGGTDGWLCSDYYGLIGEQKQEERRRQQFPFGSKERRSISSNHVWETTVEDANKKRYRLAHHGIRAAESVAILCYLFRLYFYEEMQRHVPVLALPEGVFQDIFNWQNPWNDDEEQASSFPKFTTSLPDWVIFTPFFSKRIEFQSSHLTPKKFATKMANCPAADPVLFLLEHRSLMGAAATTFNPESTSTNMNACKAAPVIEKARHANRAHLEEQWRYGMAYYLTSPHNRSDVSQDPTSLPSGLGRYIFDFANQKADIKDLIDWATTYHARALEVIESERRFGCVTSPGFHLQNMEKQLREGGFYSLFTNPLLSPQFEGHIGRL